MSAKVCRIHQSLHFSIFFPMGLFLHRFPLTPTYGNGLIEGNDQDIVAQDLGKQKSRFAADTCGCQIQILNGRDLIMPTISRTPRKKKFTVLGRQLASQRNELRLRIDRHRMDAVIDRDLDDEAAAAVENATKDMLAVMLERERRTLNEVESALIRLQKGEYGVCDTCGTEIPEARLLALPSARLCVQCAERATNSKSFRVSI